MFRTALKGLLANKVRFMLTASSVVIGVAFVAGSFVFTDSINARFETLFTDVYSGVDATVRPDEAAFGAEEPFLDESLLSVVSATDGVDRAAGSVGGVAQLIDVDGEPIGGQGPPTLGFSWVEDPALNALRIDASNGRAPLAPGEIAIDVATAEAQDFVVGDVVAVETKTGTESFTIVGLANFGTEDNLAGATLSAFELTEAQRLFSLEGKLTSIDVVADSGVSPDDLVASLVPNVTDRAEVVTGDQQTQEQLDAVTDGLGFLGTALLAFAGIAVFVGAFGIQNTFRITIAQRVRELALLRAIGATGAQVTRMVLIEAAFMGVVASVVGVFAGIGVAGLIKAGMGAVGVGIPDGPLSVEPRTVIVAMTVGVVVTVAAAVLPARRAASIAPVAAMGEPSARTTRKSLRVRGFAGSVTTIGGAALMGTGLVLKNDSSLILVSAGAVALFLGMSVLAPFATGPIARVLSTPFRGITGRLARENTVRQPRRTASTASALMIGVSLVVFVSIFAASIKASVAESLDSAFPADLTFTTSNFEGGISPFAVDRLESVPELESVSAIRSGHFNIDGESLNVVGVDPDTVGSVYDVGSSVSLSELAGGMFVYDEILSQQGWQVGDTVLVGYEATGSVPTKIVGTMDEQTFANYLISDETFVANIGDDQVAIVLAKVGDGLSLEDGQAAASSALAEFPSIAIDTKSEFVADAEAQVDQLVSLFSGLLSLALLIAVLGIANTLALSIFERTREIGLLRAVGMARRQVRSMVRIEAVIVALFGAVMGLAMGAAIGFGVVTSLADNGLGSFAVPGVQLVIWLVVAAAAGLVASLRPASKAAKLNVLEAISHD